MRTICALIFLAVVSVCVLTNISAYGDDQTEEVVYAVVSNDSGAVTSLDGSTGQIITSDKIVSLSQSAFNHTMVPILRMMDGASGNFDSQSKNLEVDQVEVSMKVTGEGHFAIVSGSTEGSIKFILKRKSTQPTPVAR